MTRPMAKPMAPRRGRRRNLWRKLMANVVVVVGVDMPVLSVYAGVCMLYLCLCVRCSVPFWLQPPAAEEGAPAAHPCPRGAAWVFP